MGRVASGKYVYKPGDHKHLHTWRECAHCGADYLGRVDSNSRFCSRQCSGKANGRQPRPAASRDGYLICTKCGEEKPEAQFDLHMRSRGGRRPHCKACRAQEFQRKNQSPEFKARQREINRRWQADNPERVAEKGRRWRATNPHAARAVYHRRRARKRLGTISVTDGASLVAKWNYWAGRCWMCGGEAVEWDHIKPLAKGGSHCLANLRPACRSCNGHKSAKWPYQPS